MTTRIRDELERSWPKNNNEMMMKMTPLRALAENAKRVLAETKKFLDEFDEDGIKDDDKDIDRARKEIEQLAGETRGVVFGRDGVFCEKERRGRVCVLLGRWDSFGG